MAYQAQDTFIAELDGAPLLVTKGTVWADNHPVVKLDAGRGLLFRPLDMGEVVPAKPRRGRPPKAAAGDGANGDGGSADGDG